MISTLWRYFKPSKKVLTDRVIVTEDKEWISNGYFALKREYYYCPHMECILDTVPMGGSTLASTPNENIGKLYMDKDFVEVTDEDFDDYRVNLSDVKNPRVLIRISVFSAGYVGALHGYLKERYKDVPVKLFLQDGGDNNLLIAKIQDEVVGMVMPLNL